MEKPHADKEEIRKEARELIKVIDQHVAEHNPSHNAFATALTNELAKFVILLEAHGQHADETMNLLLETLKDSYEKNKGKYKWNGETLKPTSPS